MFDVTVGLQIPFSAVADCKSATTGNPFSSVIDALQVAVGEKDVADAALAADGGVLAVVDADGCGLGLCGGVAETEEGAMVSGTSAGAIGAFHDAKLQLFSAI